MPPGETLSADTTSSTSTPPSPATYADPTNECNTGGCYDGSLDSGRSFLGDLGPCASQPGCDVWIQNCPEGDKCAASDDCGVEDHWVAPVCTRLDPRPGQPGDPCVIDDGPTSGQDSCRLASMCWNVDPVTRTGTCISLCAGSATNPVCDDPSDVCLVSNGGALNVCIAACDPLDPACPEGEGCHPIAADAHAFACMPDGVPIEIEGLRPTECPHGETAVRYDHLASRCAEDEVCCTPYCALDAASCARGLECRPWSDRPETSGHVGVCVDALNAPPD